ncbi:MAG: ArsA family ATPase [Chloroflexi bacterium]|nr:ArsA family ATPase [Chloroflexota bacterium]
MRILLYTGKGGVGKTTLAAATALYGARDGKRVLAVSTDIAHSLGDALATPLNNTPRAVGDGGLEAAEVDSGTELARYWGAVREQLANLLMAEGISETAAGELAVPPGLDQILALARIRQWHSESAYDALVIDSAPTGAAMRLLAAPDLAGWYARRLQGLRGAWKLLLPALRSKLPAAFSQELIEAKLSELAGEICALQELLTDAETTSVRLVLNPEALAVRETQRAYTSLSLYGLHCDAVYVNRYYPPEVTDEYLRGWMADQARYRAEVHALFEPLRIYEVPLQRGEVVGAERLLALAEGLYGGEDPLARLADEQPVRYELRDGRYTLELAVRGLEHEEVRLERRGDELFVRLGNWQRTLVLPQFLAGADPDFAEIDARRLRITFSAR